MKERRDIDIQHTTQYGQHTPDGLRADWLRQTRKNILENTWNFEKGHAQHDTVLSHIECFHVTSSPTRIQSKMEDSCHVGVQDCSFYGNLVNEEMYV